MSEYVVTDTELTAVANAIRTKGGTSADLEWNADFISAIESISGGGGAKNILKGTDTPSASLGRNGDVYLQYGLDGYTPIEYIQSNGTQYITTDYVPTLNTKAEIKINPQVISESGILGSKWALNGFFLMFYQNKIRWHESGAVDSSAVTANTDLLIEVDNENLKVNGTSYAVTPSTGLTGEALSVFYTTNITGIAPAPPKGQFKLYYLKLYENGMLKNYYIPVKRNSDDVLGLYELFSGRFYANNGTGTFTAGGEIAFDSIAFTYCKVNGAWQMLEGTDIDDVNTEGGGGGVLSGESAPSASLGSDGDLYVQKMDLPDDVNFVEYLKSSGTQYINTGVYATQDIDVTVTFDRGSGTSGSSANIGCALGVRTGGFLGMSKTIYFGSHTDNNGGISVIKTGNSNEGTVYNKTGVSTRRTKTYKDVNGYYVYCSTIDEVASYAKMYRQTGSWQSDHTLYMFAFYNSDTFSSANSAKVHRVTLFDKGVPIKDYLPCLDTSDVPCMWDNVAKEYVYNDGTGTFAYGSAVTPDKISDVLYEKKNGAWVYVGDVDDVNTGE